MNDIFKSRDGGVIRGEVAEVMESAAPVWERMPGEHPRAYEAAWKYFKMNPKRSQTAVARALNKENSQIQEWSTRWAIQGWTPLDRNRRDSDHLVMRADNAMEWHQPRLFYLTLKIPKRLGWPVYARTHSFPVCRD